MNLVQNNAYRTKTVIFYIKNIKTSSATPLRIWTEIKLIMTLTQVAIESITSVFTNSVLAALTLLLGLALGQLVGKLVQLVLSQFDLNSALSSAGLEIPAEQMASSLVTHLIYFVFIIFALSILGLAPHIFSLLGILLSIIIVAYMLLGLRDFVPNAFAGIIIARRKLLKVGLTITTAGLTGTIRHMTLTETRLLTKEGDLIAIPNTQLIKQPVVIRK